MTNTVWEELKPLWTKKKRLSQDLEVFQIFVPYNMPYSRRRHVFVRRGEHMMTNSYWVHVHLLPKRTKKKKKNLSTKVQSTKRDTQACFNASWSTVSGAVSYDRYTELVWFYLAIIYVRNTLMNGNTSLWDKLLEQRALSWSEKHCTHAAKQDQCPVVPFTVMWEERFGKSFL